MAKKLDFSADQDQQFGAVIKAIGVGGGGTNAINHMINQGVSGVEFIVANTDVQALESSPAQTKLQLGPQLTKGLGAGSTPEVGEEAARESEQAILEAVRGADMVFVAAGMGGGTGSGAAPVVSRIAKEQGALTVAVVTRPFNFEGPKRQRYASEYLAKLQSGVDAMVVVSNNRLLDVIDRKAPIEDAFKAADDVLLQGVRGISDLITSPGLINLDFKDVETVMKNAGMALMGIGTATGDNRAADATKAAIASPLLEVEIAGASDVLLNISGGKDLSLFEAQTAADVVAQAAGNDVNIVFGTTVNDRLKDEVRVTVVATGIDGQTTRNASSASGSASFGDESSSSVFDDKPAEDSTSVFNTSTNSFSTSTNEATVSNNDDLFSDWNLNKRDTASGQQYVELNVDQQNPQPVQVDFQQQNDQQPAIFDNEDLNNTSQGNNNWQQDENFAQPSQPEKNEDSNDSRIPPFFKRR